VLSDPNDPRPCPSFWAALSFFCRFFNFFKEKQSSLGLEEVPGLALTKVFGMLSFAFSVKKDELV